ncbi:hypothetical protein BZA70DRAFT_280092, partial [Myxozyma melibiosi]
MEFATSSYNWFDKISATLSTPANGFILIDSKTGMCLDVRGVAQKEDASKLFLAAKESVLDESGNGAVEYRKSRILLHQEPNCLVGVYLNPQKPSGL